MVKEHPEKVDSQSTKLYSGLDGYKQILNDQMRFAPPLPATGRNFGDIAKAKPKLQVHMWSVYEK